MRQWQLPYVMAGLSEAKTFGELSSELKIPSATLSKCLKILVKNEYAELKLLDEHYVRGRAKWIYKLTPKGVKHSKYAKAVVKHEKELWDQLLSED